MTQSLLGPDNLSDGSPSQVDVYTDGGCDPNPGPGGWAAIIRWDGREWVLSGNDPDTTNNRMELLAPATALALLEGLLGRCHVNIHTDSASPLCYSIPTTTGLALTASGSPTWTPWSACCARSGAGAKEGPHQGKKFWGCSDFLRRRGLREYVPQEARQDGT